MAHNVKIKYYPRENTQLLPHSFFGQPLPNGTYGFDEMCAEASNNTSIEQHTIRAAIQEYVKVAKKKLLDGFRVEIGQQFLTLGPGLTAKVKDELNDDGTVKRRVTADDLTAVGAKSRVTAVVNPEFSYEFNRSVRWQKTDRHGNPLEPDEDDATQDADSDTNPGGGSGSGSGQQGGGSGDNQQGGGTGGNEPDDDSNEG